MFKKPFNREVGETRQCKKCDTIFHTFKPVWQCNSCAVKQVRKYNEGNYTPKDAYPFNNKELYGNHRATKRFTQIRQRLNQCKTREELTQHYDRQLKEIEDNGILKWIWDRRDNGTVKANRKKSKSMTQRDWPDTRGWYED